MATEEKGVRCMSAPAPGVRIKPYAYWEKRIVISEEILSRLMGAFEVHSKDNQPVPPEFILSLRKEWVLRLNKLDKRYGFI